MAISNYERWMRYMKDITSPESFIRFGYYYMIAAALQRRVWTGPEHQPLFPNMYVILVGDPGVGKGLVIKQVAEFLRFHKLRSGLDSIGTADLSTPEKAAEFARAELEFTQANKNKKDDLQLIPVAADASTYEALVRASALAIRYINYKKWNPTLEKYDQGTYGHSSLCFCLEEISSLFRKKTEDLVNYLLHAFDCGDYEYDTKTQGRDRVKKCCLSFFGGTTPAFMQTTFSDKLLNEGFSSRTIFVFEYANRFNKLFFPELSAEQKEDKQKLLEHIKRLSTIYGKVEMTPEAIEFMETWWQQQHTIERPNRSMKMDAYYARKNIHALKMAMAIHFSEDAEVNELNAPKNPITVEECKSALKLLEEVEMKMHYALGFDNQNPLAAPAKKIKEYIKKFGPQTRVDLMFEFNGLVRESELNEILMFLQNTSQLFCLTSTDTVLQKPVNIYSLKKSVEQKDSNGRYI
jgi:hypothetical protein